MCVYIYIYIHIYICLFPFVCVCVAHIHVLFNFGLNLSIKFISFIRRSVVWYIGIILNLHRLHLYMGFNTFIFLFFFLFWYYSCEVMSLYFGPVLTLCIFLCIGYIQLCGLRFLICSFIYFEFCFRLFKGLGFHFFNYITYFTSFFFFCIGNPFVMCFLRHNN